MRTIAGYVVLPLLFAVVAGVSYLGIQGGWHLDYLVPATLVFTIGYLLIFERIIPLKAAWVGRPDEARMDIYHFIGVSLFSVLGNSIALVAALRLHAWLGIEWAFWVGLSFIPAYIIANLIGELIPYWYHRLSHVASERSRVSLFLWHVHAIHHIPLKLNWRKTNWMHPVNSFLNSFTKLFPLMFLGFSAEVVFAVGLTNLVVSYSSHANIRARTGFLDYLIVTPRVHHFHHSTNLDEAKNYANVIPVLDMIFGTYFNNGREVREVGIVAGAGDNYPSTNDINGQMRFPFKE